jgi:3-oxoadipate enol-lactonase
MLAGRRMGNPDAPALILAHPIGFDGRFWRELAERLSAHFALVIPDARGHGTSARGAGETSIDQLARDILSVMDALGIAKAGYVGCSMGSMVGMRLGAMRPERFNWLVLANAPARINLSRDVFDQRIAQARNGGFAHMAPAILARWLAPDTAGMRPDWFAARLDEMMATCGDGFADAFAALRDSDRSADLCEIGVPALVVTGAFDDSFPPEAAAALAQSIDGGQVSVVPRAGHLVPLEQPDVVATLVHNLQATPAAKAAVDPGARDVGTGSRHSDPV